MVGVSGGAGVFTGMSFPSALALPASARTQSDRMLFGVQIAMTALADASCFMISSRWRSAAPRLVSHQTFQPSASSIATSFDASDRSVLA